MKTLVLGGCGFIGSHLVDRLLQAKVDVAVFDRAPERYRERLNGVAYYIGDFSDSHLLERAMTGVDVVYHLISSTVPSSSNLDPEGDIVANLLGAVRLLKLMIQKKVPKIVFLSSGGTVYGLNDGYPLSEHHPLRPICSYGVVKVAIENYLQMFSHLYGLKYVVLRASNPYGARQGQIGIQGIIGTCLNKILTGNRIEIWGDGKVVRDFIHINDLADLCLLAASKDVQGIFNSGSGVGCSIVEVVTSLGATTNQALTPVFTPSRGYDIPTVVLDISHATRTFGWTPRIGLVEGLAQTWEWVNSKNNMVIKDD